MIRGITFSEQTFYSKDFAHYMNFFLNGGCGITKGCSITHDGTKVTIGTGYFVAHGRLMNVEEAEVVDATKGFQSGYNRIVYEIDLSKENTIIDFRQGYIKVLNTSALTQQDLDGTGTVYQFPLCHFQWSGTTITSFVVDAPTLVLDDIMQQWSDNFDSINQQFDAWFTAQKNSVTDWVNQQKQTVEDLIAGLEAQGFQKTAVVSSGTLLSSGWNASTKKYSFESSFPSSECDITIEPDGDSITEEQLKAYAAAKITGSKTSNVYKAIGDVPTINIPVIIRKVVK